MSLFFILRTFPPRFKGTVYRQFIDDVFLFFQTKNPFETKFMVETEENELMLFLDVAVSHEKSKMSVTT